MVRVHPLVGAAGDVLGALKAVADVNPTFMSVDEKAEALLALSTAQAVLAETRLRVLAAAGDVAEAHGARDAGVWLAAATRGRRGDAAADLRLARVLDTDLPVLAAGLREGRVNMGQAHAVAHAIAELPTHVGAEVRGRAEAHLVAQCATFGPTEITRLGRGILNAVAPEIAEAIEAQRLLDLETNAAQRARLRMRRLGDGLTRLSAVLPDATATRLATYLNAYTNPRRETGSDGAAGGGDGAAGAAGAESAALAVFNTRPRRLAEAFGSLLESLDPTRLPLHGGDATTLVVTITIDALRTDLATATLPHTALAGTTDINGLTAAQARRLACTARIIPAVLDSHSEVLDLGHTKRLFTPAQRRALAIRDHTCRAEHCTIPATWTEAHHQDPWHTGGPTNLNNAVLLCSHHHHRAHDPHHTAEPLPNGDIRFHRRP